MTNLHVIQRLDTQPGPSWATPDLSVCEENIRQAPPFPRHVLPKPWGKWCADVAAAANASYDYVAATLLSTGAGLIGNSVRIRASASFIQPSVLWVCLVGKSGAGKTPATAVISDILDDLERKSGIRNRLRDATVAASVKLASENEKGLVLFRDELSGWWANMKRTGGEDFYLEAFNGKPFSKDRKNDKPIYIDKLSISVVGGAQPDVVRDITTDGKNRGFSARWLFCYPEPVQGYAGDPVEPDIEWASTAMESLRALPVDYATIPLSAEAQAIFRDWWNQKKHDTADEEGLWGDWIQKQGGNALRIALCLEMLGWCATLATPFPEDIGTATIQNALTLIDDWAFPMAERTLQVMNRPVAERHATTLAKFLRRQGVESFNARRLRRGEYGRPGPLADTAALDSACNILVEAGVIRHVGTRNHTHAGRAALDFEVNPLLRRDNVRPLG